MRTSCLTYILSVTIPIAFYSGAFAQEISGNDAQENLFKLGGVDVTSGIVRKFDARYEGVKGTPFYIDKWSPGSIALEGGQFRSHPRLKYNQYEDELIIQQAGRSAYYVPKDKISSFTLQDDQGHSQQFIKKNHPKKKGAFQFYRTINTGEIFLLEFTKVIFEKADFEGGYSNEKKFDEFKRYPSYYYLSKDETTPTQLKKTTNAVSKTFPGHQDKIKAFITENGLDCRNLEDLSRIFSYYNSLP